MTWVKVCGLRTERDVATAVTAGADAVGFVLAERSPRRVSIDDAAGLMDGIPVLRVLVTAHLEPEGALAALEATGADGIQAHGRHAEEVAAASEDAGRFVLRPVAMGGTEPQPDPLTVPDGQVPLLDSTGDESLGGTGVTFDWSAIPAMGRRFVLAGGLGPDNVRAAIETVGPWGVDASSGLEAQRGIKDPGRVVAFIEEAKRI